MKQIKVFAAIAIFLAADQISKAAAVMSLKGREGISILKDIFELQYVENRGAAFWNSSKPAMAVFCYHSACCGAAYICLF